MFDDVTCEHPLPDVRKVPGRAFQTKSLWCDMDHFTITAAGRLIFHRYQCLPPGGRIARRSHVGDEDLNYHGDLVIYGVDAGDTLAQYAVRFTHGTVEWVRPLNDLPYLHRECLLRVR